MTMRRKLAFGAGAAVSIAALSFLAAAISQQSVQQAALVRGNAPYEWRVWGADAWSTRYSAASQIDASNFDSLKVAWQWRNPDTTAIDEYYRTTPLYAKGRIFTVQSNRRAAFGIDPVTGKTLWSWKMDEGIRWQKAPRQFAGRGLAYWTDGANERVLVITPGYHLVSLNAKTGKPDPAFGTKGIVDLMKGLGYPLVPLAVDDDGPNIISEAAPARKAKPGEKWDPVKMVGADGTMGIDPANGQIANSSPGIVVGNVFVVGNSSMHGYYPLRLHNIPGFIRGFDIKTGKQLWKFNLVPQAGEFGAETWKNGSAPGTDGVGKNDAWATYSADPELGLVYIPVGEGLSDEYGGHRPGDNLFANSVVAIDVKTGLRKWHFQMVHHDIWDYDTPMAPNLLDVTIDGVPRKVIASTTKQGWVYVFDRVTGKPIWPMPETPVLQSEVPGEQPSPTQPIPSKPAAYAQQGLVESDIIDYTPAIKEAAMKLAKKCRMAPYFIPASPADGKGANGPAEYECSWYAPGAAGGVNIDGGTAADPETGMIYVGGQSGLGTIEVMKDPCSEHRYSQPHNSCGLLGALPAPEGYQGDQTGGRGQFGTSSPTALFGISIVKPKEMGGITAYDLHTGDKKWWVPNGNRWRDVAPVRDTAGLFNGVTLPKIPALGGQPEVITTKTLVIHGTGRGGGGGGGGGGGRGGRGGAAGAPAGPPAAVVAAVRAAVDARGGGGFGGGGGGRANAPPATPPQLYAFDKETGKQVGAVSIPAVNTAVPMTFMHQGKQYIVFATGQGYSTTLTALALPRK